MSGKLNLVFSNGSNEKDEKLQLANLDKSEIERCGNGF